MRRFPKFTCTSIVLVTVTLCTMSYAQENTINQDHALASKVAYTLLTVDHAAGKVTWHMRFSSFRWTRTELVANVFRPDGSLCLSQTFKTKFSDNRVAEETLTLTNVNNESEREPWNLQIYSGGVLLDQKNFFLNEVSEPVNNTSKSNPPSPVQQAQQPALSVTEHKIRIQPSLLFGSGREKNEVATTTSNKIVDISAGGGIGFNFLIGYEINPELSLDFGLGRQWSSLSEKVKDADGEFKRTSLSASAKYIISLSTVNSINIVGGADYYMGGTLDVDLSEYSSIGGAHNIRKYDNAPGYHLGVEFERQVSPKMAYGVGLYYSYVKYDLKRLSSNGVYLPPAYLSSDELSEIDGSGIYMALFAPIYF